MNKLVLVFFVCAVSLQVQIEQKFFFLRKLNKKFYFFFIKNKQQIQADIPVPNFQPNYRQFYTNLRSITSKIRSLQIVEPNVCIRLRDRVEENRRRYTGYANEDKNKIDDTIRRSKSDKVKDATDAVKLAYDKVSDEFKKIIDSASTLISNGCKQLSSVEALNTINQAMNDLRSRQRDAAPQLADLPRKYIEIMQSHQAAIEAINVKV